MLLEKRYQRYTNIYSADEYQTPSPTPTPSPSPMPTPTPSPSPTPPPPPLPTQTPTQPQNYKPPKPLSWSIFLEGGLATGTINWVTGFELVLMNGNDLYLVGYMGESVCADMGGSISVGIEVSSEDNIY